jgi:hypothetical protein
MLLACAAFDEPQPTATAKVLADSRDKEKDQGVKFSGELVLSQRSYSVRDAHFC